MVTADTLQARKESANTDTHGLVSWRLMPLLLICYFFANLDRINIGFAKMQMSSDLAFSETVYGLGAGLFFIAYAMFGLPSNLLLDRFGPRRWIASIMFVWGILSTCMLFVQSPLSFYCLRFALGVAEAGFFPGIMVYLNRWYPTSKRAQITALLTLAVPLSGVIGAPISGAILVAFQDFSGLRGWQWMFLLEGLPVVFLSIIVFMKLPDSFENVNWLSSEQKDELREQLAQEDRRKPLTSISMILLTPAVWLMVAIYFAVMLAVNTVAFWMPTLIHGAGVDNDGFVGLLTAIPYLAGCIFMVMCGRSSDRRKERRWHLAVPMLIASLGITITAIFPHSLGWVLFGLVLAGMGASAALPMFWQFPPAYLSNSAKAAGIAIISSCGSMAAFFAPYLIGSVRDATQSSSLALYILAFMILIGGFSVLITKAKVVNPA